MSMAVPNTKTIEIVPKPTAADRVADAVRQAAHLSLKTHQVRSMAREASEEGMHAAKRALRRAQRRIEALEDLKDEAAHYVKRQPFKAVGLAFGVGIQLGILIALLGGRFGHRRHA
jgi:ElaB/YqjD/DUF883 family membrane-anchored ribosome-binding protein